MAQDNKTTTTDGLKEFIKYIIIAFFAIFAFPLMAILLRTYFRFFPIEDSEYLGMLKFMIIVLIFLAILAQGIKIVFRVLEYKRNEQLGLVSQNVNPSPIATIETKPVEIIPPSHPKEQNIASPTDRVVEALRQYFAKSPKFGMHEIKTLEKIKTQAGVDSIDIVKKVINMSSVFEVKDGFVYYKTVGQRINDVRDEYVNKVASQIKEDISEEEKIEKAKAIIADLDKIED